MPITAPFPHLPLPQAIRNRARPGSSTARHPRTEQNRQERVSHSAKLKGEADKVVQVWQQRRAQRQAVAAEAGQTVLPAGISLLLEVEDGFDLDFLRTAFGFDLVSEEEEGFVIVATQDVDLFHFQEELTAFGQGDYGSQTASAKIYGVHDDEERLSRVLSDGLRVKWPTLDDGGTYTVDVDVSCGSTIVRPKLESRRASETEERFTRRKERWREKDDAALIELDETRIERENHFEAFLRLYGPHFIDGYIDREPLDGGDGPVASSSDFTQRLAISGKGLRDLVLNYPYLFGVSEVDEISVPPSSADTSILSADELTLLAPEPDAPAVCVIDSGIQEQHRLLRQAVDGTSSISYVPGGSATDVSDYVQGGHGTRVAGAILYPDGIPTSGTYRLPFWIQNARVLDDSCIMSSALLPWRVLPEIVHRFKSSGRQTRIYNQSIASLYPYRQRHMSAWAAAMDALSFEQDVLFIQAAGNVADTSTDDFLLGIREHLQSGGAYPTYLMDTLCRVPNPAQSVQAITVGSVIREEFADGDVRSFAGKDRPSSFSRTGLGIWNSVKPDVVEYGGDYVVDSGEPPSLTIHGEMCPELVRGTRAGGPLTARDTLGTSFAAPKVTHIAARLQALLPDEPTLLYRALIAQSAQWPAWARQIADPEEALAALRHIGYGIPDPARATENDDYRVTLITSGEQRLRDREAHIFEIPIPRAIRTPSESYDVRVEVTLSFAAAPRRTRRNLRGYLGTRLEWEPIRRDESLAAFQSRVFDEEVRQESQGRAFTWHFQRRAGDGRVRGTSRVQSTLQKDWAVVKSYQLPETFAVAVIGRRGWSTDPEDFARYALAVTFEAVNRDVEVYESVRAEIRSTVEARVEPEVRVELSPRQ